ncbi:MAG: hypothetical protein JWQ30_1531 [Sediminibacterium sp.]|nr:hypothetical protein [Sediminibacterium sp.]
MSKEDIKDLIRFIKPYPAEIQELTLWLREFVWGLYPKANELIYDNYNAVAFGWSITQKLGQTFCSVAVMSKYVHFGFYWGSQIADPEKKLLGNGSQYRYIIINKKTDLPKTYIKKLLKEAYANSLAKVKDPADIVEGTTTVRCSLAVKKRPGTILPPRKKK